MKALAMYLFSSNSHISHLKINSYIRLSPCLPTVNIWTEISHDSDDTMLFVYHLLWNIVMHIRGRSTATFVIFSVHTEFRWYNITIYPIQYRTCGLALWQFKWVYELEQLWHFYKTIGGLEEIYRNILSSSGNFECRSTLVDYVPLSVFIFVN